MDPFEYVKYDEHLDDLSFHDPHPDVDDDASDLDIVNNLNNASDIDIVIDIVIDIEHDVDNDVIDHLFHHHNDINDHLFHHHDRAEECRRSRNWRSDSR